MTGVRGGGGVKGEGGNIKRKKGRDRRRKEVDMETAAQRNSLFVHVSAEER